MRIDEFMQQMKDLNCKFRHACKQVRQLNVLISTLQRRYDRAVRDNCRAVRYNLRLRLATCEGVRNMFYEYAVQTAEDLELLQERLVDHRLDADTDDEESFAYLGEDFDFDLDGSTSADEDTLPSPIQEAMDTD